MRSEIRLGLSILLALQMVLPVWAADDPFAFLQEEAMVVAASQHPQKLSQVPASAYVITAEDIERYGYRTLAEALQSVPGIISSNDRNYSYLWFRGFGLPSDYNNRILVQVDGHRMNDEVYGGVLPGQEFSVDMKVVDHIEVIKGPASALYGNNALFGVVNIVTKSAGRAPLVDVSAETGSYGTHKESLALAHTFANGPSVYVGGSYRNMKGQDLYYPQFADINNGVAAGSDGEHNSTFLGKLDYAGFTLEGNVGSRTKHIPTASFADRFNDSGSQTTDVRSFMELRSDHRLTSQIELNSRFYYDWYDYEGDYMYNNAAPPPEVVKNLDWTWARSYGEEIHARLTPWGSENALTVGQEYEKTLQSRQQNYDEGTLPPYPTDVSTTPQRWAAYAQQEWQPYSGLSLTAGGRYDHYETFGKTVNPRLAAVHNLWPDSTLKATYGSAFRAPTAFEMFYGGITTFVTNPDLQPEKISSYELIWEQQFPGRGMVRVSGYENRVKNLIEQATLDDGRIQFQNRGTVESIGMELYSKWSWNSVLSGFAGYDLQRTRELDGSPLSNSPRHSGSAGLSAWIERTRTTLSLQSFFVSSRRTFQETTLPTTTLFSVILRQSLGTSGPILFASVYNLLDTNYSVSGAAEHLQDAIPQDGRNFTVGLEIKFR
jgi:iron complex outermembrane receptor protein